MALSCYRQLENITLGQILCTTAPVLAGFAREAAGLAAQGRGAAQLGWKIDPEMKARSLKALAEDLEAIYSSVRFHSGPTSADRFAIHSLLWNEVFREVISLIPQQALDNAIDKHFSQVGQSSREDFDDQVDSIIQSEVGRAATDPVCKLFCYLRWTRELNETTTAGIGRDLFRTDLGTYGPNSLIRNDDKECQQSTGLRTHGQGESEYPTWSPSGCEITCNNLKALLSAVKETWGSKATRSRDLNSHSQAGRSSGRLSQITSVKLLMEGNWSESPSGSHCFRMLFGCPQGLQETVVDTNRMRTEQWKSARDFHLLSGRIYNWGVGNGGDIGADPSAPHDRRHHPSWDSALELSLAEVLTEELHHQEKMVLCWHIARAVLDLFATGWLAPDWGITDIVIFGWADGHSRHLDLRHPYLSVDSIDDAAAWLDRAHICSPDLDPVHPFPHILSLGVVLLQVLLGERLEKLGLGGDEKGDLRRKTDQAHRLRSECELRFPSRWPIMEAANLCIEFRASSWGPASLGSTVATRANLLRAWKNVVSCLERGVLDNQRLPQTNFGLSRFLEESRAPRKSVLGDLEQLMWRLKFIRKHKTDVTQDPSPDPPIGKTGKTEITIPIITKSPKLTRSLEHSPSLIALANKFLAPLRAISNGLRAIGDRDMDGAFRPDRVWDNMVRVAILDTGCNFSQPLMKGLIVGHNGGDSEIPKTQRRPGIVGWKDFVRGEAAQPGEPLSDTAENQHGSVMTYLFTQTMSHAKLYIGRVMEHASSSDPLTPERVAEAAEYAVNVWKADIISISMAIDATSEHVRERLDAVSRRALVFAAAGNNRGPDRSPIAYPASSGTAICVHSHDGHGKPSEFSPDPQPNAPNFQVIGQDLRVPSLSQSVHGSEEVVQGTSCATAIAAAIGALVLDFARAYAAVETEKQPSLADPEGPKDYMSWILHLLVTKHDLLRKEQVMKQVLYYLMTTASLRAFGKFNMVKPQLLFRVGEPGWIERAAVQLGQELEKVHENRDPQRF